MMTFETIEKKYTENKDFYAIGDNGKKYEAVYNAERKNMYFAIPSSVKILGYVEK